MKKLSVSLLALAPFFVSATAFAQAVINNGTQGTTAGDYRSSTFSEQSDKIFDADSDMINPGEGMMQWKGKIFNIEDTKFFRERFERFLSEPEPEGNRQDYEKILKRIHNLLKQESIPQNRVNGEMIKAMSMLLELSEFEVDNGQSLTLAKQVYKACRQRAELVELQAWQKALQSEHKKLRLKIDNREKSRRLQEEAFNVSTKKGERKSVPPSPEQVFLTEAAAENKAAIKARGTEAIALGTKAKLEFQSLMVSFLTTRRYEHALLSSAFYRVLFKGSQHDLKVGEKEFDELLPISNFVPSLESFDQIARELQGETRKCVKGSETLWNAGQKYHAFRQLLSAYFIGENEVRVAYYPAERKAEFLRLWFNLRELMRQSENKDLGAIEDNLKQIQAFAPDFPASEVTGKLNAAKQASNMAILRARQTAMMAGAAGTPEAMNQAMTDIENYLRIAGEYWPQNPEIPKFMEDVLNRTNVLAQLAPEFDRLVAAKKTREIFNRRAEFTAALMQDAARRERFEEIISHVAQIETVLTQVNMLLARHDDYIAWDVLLSAEAIDPEDEQVIRTKARVAPLVSDYSRLLERAVADERAGKFSEALNKYIAAEDLNNASEVCRQGIQRMAEALLASIPASAAGVPIATPQASPTTPSPASHAPASAPEQTEPGDTTSDEEWDF